jgi:uncharacterized flavoprotein (TIGR03862 family)
MIKSISVIGAGPAGLMAAETLAKRGFKVTVYDHKPSPARKFLMAGRGGLNITHSEPFEKFLTRYGEAEKFLRNPLESFTPENLRDWCHELGEETFIGTSGRVFPKSFKASPLLRAWLKRLDDLGVTFHYNFEWTGQDMGTDITILALGGASWPRLGSDGHWTKILEDKGIKINPFRPANCGFTCHWSDIFKQKFAGHPLKSIALTHDNQTIYGEIMVTQNGVEGGGIYALSKPIRTAIEKNKSTTLYLDFKPNFSEIQIQKILNAPRGRDSFPNYLRKTMGLSPVMIGLLQEDRNITNLSRTELAQRMKSYPIELTATANIDRAISSAGGIALDELTNNFELKKMPNTYAIGEMLDWEAPTGGYLLQASFSMAVWVGKNI